jgi:hypothetical protein
MEYGHETIIIIGHASVLLCQLAMPEMIIPLFVMATDK